MTSHRFEAKLLSNLISKILFVSNPNEHDVINVLPVTCWPPVQPCSASCQCHVTWRGPNASKGCAAWWRRRWCRRPEWLPEAHSPHTSLKACLWQHQLDLERIKIRRICCWTSLVTVIIQLTQRHLNEQGRINHMADPAKCILKVKNKIKII